MYLVESLTRTRVIEDLGITVSPNLPMVISGDDFAKSLCLAELIRQGHMRVSKTSLCREEVPAKPSRRKSPPIAQMPVPPISGISRAETSEVVATTVPTTFATTIKQATSDSLKDAIESLLKSTLDSVVKSSLDSAVRSAVEKSLSEWSNSNRDSNPMPEASSNRSLRKNPVKVPPEEPAISGDAPMFIPSGLVPKEVSGEVSVTSQTQSLDSLGDSASALKKLRKGASK